MKSAWRSRALVPVLSLLTLGEAAAARAGDAVVFAALPSPSDQWRRGYGAALSSTWFQVVSFEAEAARIPGEIPDGTMTSFTGSALLAPPVGFLTPYGGLGIGLFRQTLGTLSDTGVLRAGILGAKAKIGLLVVKVEYRHITLSGNPLIPMDRRISAGAGISF
jgi:hypothetical protein